MRSDLEIQEERDIKRNQLNRKLLRQKSKKRQQLKFITLGVTVAMLISASYIWGFTTNNANADTARLISNTNEDYHEQKEESIQNHSINNIEIYSDIAYRYKKAKTNASAYKIVNIDSKEAFKLKEGDYVEFFGSENGWSKIKLRNIFGYIEDSKLEDTEETKLKVIKGLLIATKNNYIPDDFKTNFDINAENSMMVMFEAMKREGLFVDVVSKVINTKDEFNELYKDLNKEEYPDFNHNELRTGRAILLKKADNVIRKFKNTDESKWLEKNSYKYGFIKRYPENKKNITGYVSDEIYTYVGTENAEKMFKENLAIEEYFK